jgi:DNA-binding CsgD family transcriptional regulator
VCESIVLWRQAIETALDEDPITVVTSADAPDVVVLRSLSGASFDTIPPGTRIVTFETSDGKGLRSLDELRQQIIVPSGPTRRAWKPPVIAPARATKQELNVLRRLGAGHTTAQIAIDMGISRYTVEGHRQRLYRRWGVHNAVEALTLAHAHQLLAPIER